MVRTLEHLQGRESFFKGTVFVQVRGSKENLSPELLAVAQAAAEDGSLEGATLKALCGQWSRTEGGNCDASVSEDLRLSSDSQEEPVGQVSFSPFCYYATNVKKV